MRVAVVQMNSAGDIETNLATIRRYAYDAQQQQAQWLVLPEMCASLNSDDYPLLANNTRYHDFFSELASATGLWIVVGAIPQLSQDSDLLPRSSQLVFDPNGQQLARYDKCHLFDVEIADPQGCYRESDSFSAGSQLAWVTTADAVVGLSICFDLRFPSHYQNLRQAGANILVVAAAFTHKTGQAHWEPLLRARAIENQCYVVAANQCGWHDAKRQSWGHSMVIDPWGRIIQSLTDQPGVLFVDLDLSLVDNIRQKMPLMPAQSS